MEEMIRRVKEAIEALEKLKREGGFNYQSSVELRGYCDELYELSDQVVSMAPDYPDPYVLYDTQTNKVNSQVTYMSKQEAQERNEQLIRAKDSQRWLAEDSEELPE